MKIQGKVLAALVILVSANLACMAADQKMEQKQGGGEETMQIKAQKISFNKETQEATASGNVVITSDGRTITSDKVVIKFEGK